MLILSLFFALEELINSALHCDAESAFGHVVVLLSPGCKYSRTCVISFPKDAAAECIKRLQRSECCFAFVLDLTEF